MSQPLEEQLREVARRLDALVTEKTPDRPWKPISVAKVMAVTGDYLEKHAEADMMTLCDVADEIVKVLEENYEFRRRLGMSERKEAAVG
jgi:iron-sulfur cluster repair protein YtfE (RIC family)